MRFRDRRHAGELLAARLVALDLHDPVVLGLPRGGVPVAAEVARRLGAPLDVIVARKVGAPGQAEFGIGALAEGFAGGAEIEVHDPSLLRLLGIDDARYAGLVDHRRRAVVGVVEPRPQGGCARHRRGEERELEKLSFHSRASVMIRLLPLPEKSR